ncbi:MAG TPA: quinone-dependent dihydroorotate dehydrogenase [Sphingomicrobium sp.]|nr:quinone-dependent dihydroorotate dehydrogenase [Sphingomicrobium sp.]
MALYKLIRPLAFMLDAETAHRATISALKVAHRNPPRHFPPSIQTAVAGIDFPSPVGLAAGFDKDGEVAEAMLGFGFGSVEIGTVTPQPQLGNPKPRLFRLTEDEAVINRMGFNNEGQEAAFERLRRLIRVHGVIGVNVGANKASLATFRGEGRQDGLSEAAIADYVAGVRRMAPVARYLTINISSPNTPGLRGLQDQGALDELLAAVSEVRGGKPVFLKVAPDLETDDPARIVRSAIDHRIDALIVANTTVSRPPLRSRLAAEAGGLSGAPLKPLALEALRRFRSASGGTIPLIGVGGIGNAEDAWQRIRAGASLVQLYSAMVYEGPGIAMRIARGLAERLEREGMSNIAAAVGTA